MDSTNDVPHPESPVTSHPESSGTYKRYGMDSMKDGPHPESARKHVSATGVIDTAAPIKSVKAALSKFDGSIDWKARRTRTQSMERRKMLEIIGKAEENPEQKKQSEAIEADLEKTTKLIIELKNNLERAKQQESQAKQNSEAARLQIEKMEQEIANELSMVAKVQLEVDEVWQREAETGLESMKEQLEALREEYASLVTERDQAIKKSEEAVAASKEVEHSVEEDLKSLNRQAYSVKDLESKLDAASALLLKLKAEFAASMESNIKQEGVEEGRKELKEVKLNREKTTDEINCLKVAAMSLKEEIEKEKSILTIIKQREGMASIAVASLEAELDKTRPEIALVQTKKKEATGMMIELPEKLKEAAHKADQAKSLAQAANIALSKLKEEAEQAKARAKTMETRLLAAQKEVEAAMASEKMATEGTKALQENELATSNNDPNSSSKVMILLDEYLNLSKQAQEAEQKANIRIAAVNSQIEMAKESELKSLEKLEDLEKELAARQESLKVARERAEKAKEEKLSAEQELRKWRDQLKEHRKAGEVKQRVVNRKNSFVETHDSVFPGCGLTHRKTKSVSHTQQTGSNKETKTKKKKSFFPRVVMFFSKRKTHPTK